jgi:hypothetical protein
MFAVVIIRETTKFADAVLKVFCGAVGALVLKPGGQDERSALGSIETFSAADPIGGKQHEEDHSTDFPRRFATR